MLNATDIHFLVGLLTVISDETAVDIELGSTVWDQVAEKTRDVDITVTYILSDGTRGAFRGIEVKDHSRPLTVEHIEQLAMKFNDMPEITQRAIVSASGYTDAAVKKAQYYQIDLVNFAPWIDRDDVFRVRFDEQFHIRSRNHSWIGNPEVSLNLNPPMTLDELNSNLHSLVYSHIGSEMVPIKNLKEFVDALADEALLRTKDTENSGEISASKEFQVQIKISLDDKPIIRASNKDITIEDATISGYIMWTEVASIPEFKMLVRHGETKPYVGCAIGELPNGNLFAATFTELENNAGVVWVDVNNRLKRKIYRHKLK